MSISQRQIDTVTEQAVDKSLKDGILPSTSDINTKVSKYFESKTPGLPYYRPKPVEDGQCSDPVSYNQMFSNAATDLDILFKENVYQNNRILSMFDYYMTEKERLEAAVEKLQLRVDTLMDSLKSDKATETFIESFNNFYGVEMYGNRLRNIPRTSAFIDLIQRKVYSEKMGNASDKIDISGATITLTPKETTTNKYELGTQKNILKDTLNETYTMVYEKETDGEMTVTLAIELAKAAVMSSVMITMKSTKAVNISLSISEDGSVYRDQMDMDTVSSAEWNFNKTSVKFLKFTIKKFEPDADTGKTSEYYFTFTNISCVNETFLGKTTFVSKQISINKIPDQVTIKAEDIVYPNTEIKYYFGLDNGIDKIDWRLVKNGEPFNFGLLSRNRDIISGSGYTGREIYQLHPNTDNNTIQLMMGYQQWFVEEFQIDNPFIKNAAGEDTTERVFGDNYINFIPGIRYMSYPKTAHKFVDCEKYTQSVGANKMLVFTQFVFADQDYNMTNRTIQGPGIHSIYVNNVVTQGIKDKDIPDKYLYNLTLVQGLNKVQICMFSPAGGAMTHNINLKAASFDIFAKLKVKQVTLHNLENNTQVGDMNYFAVDSLTGMVKVKFDPTDEALSDTLNDGDHIRFVIDYKYASNEVLTKYPSRKVKFRVMATLSSYIDDISPQIMNYRIISD